MKRNLFIFSIVISLLINSISAVLFIRAFNKVTYYYPEETKILDPNWLIDPNYSKKNIKEAITQFNLWNEYFNKAREAKKYQSTISIAVNNSKNPKSPCYKLSINQCHSIFLEGLIKEAKETEEEESLFNILFKSRALVKGSNSTSGLDLNNEQIRLHLEATKKLNVELNRLDLEGKLTELKNDEEWSSD
jgi:hypothetical protein